MASSSEVVVPSASRDCRRLEQRLAALQTEDRKEGISRGLQRAVADLRRYLGHEDLRCTILGIVARFPEVLALCTSDVALLIEDSKLEIREAVVATFSSVDPVLLAECAGPIMLRLSHVEEVVRVAAATVLQALMPHGLQISDAVLLLSSSYHIDRCCALVVLSLDPAALLARSSAIAEKLVDDVACVRCAAIGALSGLPDAELEAHGAKIVRCFSDSDPDTKIGAGLLVHRLLAANALHRLPPVALALHVRYFVERLADANTDVRRSAVGVLGRLDTALYTMFLTKETLLHHAASLGHMPVVEVLSAHHHGFLNSRDFAGNTPLHAAAQAGRLEICQLLVSTGALTKVKNRQKQTPLDLACRNDQADIADLLRRHENVATVRGGAGDAFVQALGDERPVVGVEWYTISLPGVVGSIGGKHSLLKVSVGFPAELPHAYVIEKAAVMRGDSEANPEQFKNGVHVSHWLDVVPNVKGASVYALRGADVQNNTRGALTMATLRAIAVDLGPYNVGKRNCHHAAIAVFNACARSGKRVPWIPNVLLTRGAQMLGGVGLDVTTSTASQSVGSHSTASQSVTSQSVVSQSAVCHAQAKKSADADAPSAKVWQDDLKKAAAVGGA